ncbi:hypothetical protein GR238_39215, partial [Rhizobium leguminosarum]|uniref:hypothetical protein n=1 Tax=Rhizobium ruizarguesonis TaxID=2081791 RepID=UPI0013BE128E
IKGDGCLVGMITEPVPALIEKGRRGYQVELAINIVARLQLMGRNDDAAALLKQVVEKVAGLDALPQILDQYQDVMLPYLNQVKNVLGDNDLLALYERSISVPGMAGNKAAIDALNNEFIRSLSVIEY